MPFRSRCRARDTPAHDPVRIISELPHQLGYHPNNELVLVYLRHQQPVGGIRLQLPAAMTPDQVADIEDGAATAQADSIVIVGYGAETLVGPAAEAAQAALNRARPSGAFRVENRHYYPLSCPPGCACPPGRRCHPEGLPIPDVPAAVAAASGTPRTSRRQVVEALLPTSGRERLTGDYETLLASFDMVAQQPHPVMPWLPAPSPFVADARQRVENAPEMWQQRRLTDQEVARLAFALHVGVVRDEAVARAAAVIVAGSRGQAAAQVGVWLDVLRRCHVALMPVAAAVYACVAYADGQTTRAHAAVDVALFLDPDCEAARLMHNVMRIMVPVETHARALNRTIDDLRAYAGDPRQVWLHELMVATQGMHQTFPMAVLAEASRLVPGYTGLYELPPAPHP
ncbi:DUF4192 family protein [Nonomuraea polychroma]|uniref:DUF4192 family protein n=1 Tax=Nonomuraea polychroma TaxID=46176 RepID=UPI003D8C2FEF